MASGTTVFQSAITATPPAGLPIMADSVNDTDHGVGTAQYIKVMDGRTGGTIKAAVTANGMEVDVTRVQGTVQTLGSVQGVGTFQVLGSVQSVGTNQALGTFQPLAGSVHLASGTVQILGTVQTFGTSQVLGSVQTVGTSQALGTFQPLAGSVHLASRLPGTADIGTIAGTVSVLGTIQPLAGSVHLANTFPGGTIHVGTIAGTVSVGSVAGTVQVLGSVQGVGTFQVLGSVQLVGTNQVLGSVQAVGTVHIGSVQGTIHVGSVQRLTGGTVDFLGGTVAIGTVARLAGTVLTRPNQAAGEGFKGTVFTAATTNGTLVPAPAAGTYVRIWDVLVSGSAAGTAFLELGDGTIFHPVFLAANGGYAVSSAKGVRTNGTAQDILFTCSSGSWGVSVSYTLENA